ncbi:carbohydrate kinase [Chryseobacterium joostei]|uniref:Carbohydrate kinase n=1 Tax=Chryseobacterium joostei TaxID=112234 RepID=A0A1N7HV46_9FLAO|nr:carbohydrate kinase [Chryseobacterium joostei]AZA98997.1 carbohydrate kinase [Chryseobacterium joostei]SIS28717.1 fructokinase [Chryseobacterium joostei]
MNTNKTYYVVCFGEVLWDIFPSGSRAGGAPFNVAYNLFKMGIDTKMLSRIGNDQLGHQLLNQIDQWGITTDFIQVDKERPTGTVLADFDEHGEAQYEIVKEVAWDYIEALPEHKELIHNSNAFVFGSLIARNEASKKTLLELLEHSKFRIFDVNFRPPFIDFEFIKKLLHKADLVKMNKAELRTILDFLGVDYIDEDTSIRHLQDYFNLNEIILTKGSKGARYFVGSTSYNFPAVHIEIADTVGSGDSFLAGFLSKRIQGRSPEEIMKQATSLGAFITSKSGACPDYTYEEFRTFRENNCYKTS